MKREFKPGDKVSSSLHRGAETLVMVVERLTTTGRVICRGKNNRRLTLYPHQIVHADLPWKVHGK